MNLHLEERIPNIEDRNLHIEEYRTLYKEDRNLHIKKIRTYL